MANERFPHQNHLHGTQSDIAPNGYLPGDNSNPNPLYSIDHFANNPRIFEPQRQQHAWIEFDFGQKVPSTGKGFEIKASDLGSMYSKGDSDAYGVGEIPDFNTILKLAITDFQLPTHTTGPISIARANEKIKYAGNIQNGGSGSMNIQDWIGADSVRWVQYWDNLAYNIRTGKGGLAQDYKIDGNIYQYAPDGSISRTYKLIGCWIHNVTYGGTVSYGSDNASKVGFILEYDKAYPVWDK